MVNAQIQSLIDELEAIETAAAQLQDNAVTDEETSAAGDSYYDWYGRALSFLSGDREDRFRDAFEGGNFTPKIQAFLANPKAANPMHDANKPDNQLAASPYQFDFQKNFRAYSRIQRQILIEAAHAPQQKTDSNGDPNGDIFIVHGHAEDHLHSLARLVNRIALRDAVILRELPNSGRTIIEKFESHASRCSFAVALLTADDLGRAATSTTDHPRARQNVVFEAGYFVGLLGRGKVALLYEPGVELPSDLNGVLYVELTAGWQTKLAIEMRAAGINVDLNLLTAGG